MKILSLKLTVLMFVMSVTVSAQQGPTKTLTVGHLKNEPVEVVSIKLGGVTVTTGTPFTVGDDWTKDLEITIKNVSEQPVSYVSVLLYTPADEGSRQMISNSHYELGSRPDSDGPASFLQPNETAKLVHRFTHGNLRHPRPAQILFQQVFWNNDKWLMWETGKLKRRVSEDQMIYKPIPPSGARYNFPKGYVPSLALLKAAASAPQSIGICDQLRDGNPNSIKLCSDTNCTGSRCFVPHVYVMDCGLGSCDVKTQTGTLNCTHNSCAFSCSGTISANSEVICQPIESPVIVDVIGNGYSLTDVAGGVVFDISGDGQPRRVSWTAPNSDDAFLALDRNGNGSIDGGAELFGNNTSQPSSWASNGFRALAVLDLNHDGVINRSDPVFGSLLLWRDSNHNGVSETNEIVSVATTDITAFETNYKSSRKQDAYGNLFRYRAKVRGRGVEHWAWDVFLMMG